MEFPGPCRFARCCATKAGLAEGRAEHRAVQGVRDAPSLGPAWKRATSRLDRHPLFRLRRLAQDVAAAPDRLDVVLARRGVGELLAKLADEHVDDLQLRLVHAAVE